MPNALLVGFVQGQVLVSISVHDPADDVHLVRLELRELVLRVSSEVHQVAFALGERIKVTRIFVVHCPVFIPRAGFEQRLANLSVEAGEVQAQRNCSFGVGGVAVHQLLRHRARLFLCHQIPKLQVQHNRVRRTQRLGLLGLRLLRLFHTLLAVGFAHRLVLGALGVGHRFNLRREGRARLIALLLFQCLLLFLLRLFLGCPRLLLRQPLTRVLR